MATTALLIQSLICLQDDNGNPLASYKVKTYKSDGTTLAAVWEDRAKTLPTTNGKTSFALDADGSAYVYGDDVYIIRIWTPEANTYTDDSDFISDSTYYEIIVGASLDITMNLGDDTPSGGGSGGTTFQGDTTSTDETIVITDSSDPTATPVSMAANATDSLYWGCGHAWYDLPTSSWDMSATGTIAIAHGLTLADIREVAVIVRNDDDTARYMANGGDSATGVDLAITSIDATNVNLSRKAGGLFDSTAFDSTGYVRGWLSIGYVDPTFSWDYDNGDQVGVQGGTAEIRVSSPCSGDTAWVITDGTGFTFLDTGTTTTTTTGNSVVVSLGDGTGGSDPACGSATVTATKPDGSKVTGYLRSSTGTWVEQPQCFQNFGSSSFRSEQIEGNTRWWNYYDCTTSGTDGGDCCATTTDMAAACIFCAGSSLKVTAKVRIFEWEC